MTMNSTENLPARPEILNILNETRDNASFEKMLKFDRGKYLCDGQEIPVGSKFIAHCIGWAKEWVKFQDGQFIERKIYRISKGERPPERDQMDAKDQSLWSRDTKYNNGQPKDPWLFRYLLPMQNAETDEPVLFVTPSVGGRRSIDDLCSAYAHRAVRDPDCGQPIVRLQVAIMNTPKFGKVQKPRFEIIGWDDGVQPVREISDAVMKAKDFEDEIPF